jgi:hypothetical protein
MSGSGLQKANTSLVSHEYDSPEEEEPVNEEDFKNNLNSEDDFSDPYPDGTAPPDSILRTDPKDSQEMLVDSTDLGDQGVANRTRKKKNLSDSGDTRAKARQDLSTRRRQGKDSVIEARRNLKELSEDDEAKDAEAYRNEQDEEMCSDNNKSGSDRADIDPMEEDVNWAEEMECVSANNKKKRGSGGRYVRQNMSASPKLKMHKELGCNSEPAQASANQSENNTEVLIPKRNYHTEEQDRKTPILSNSKQPAPRVMEKVRTASPVDEQVQGSEKKKTVRNNIQEGGNEKTDQEKYQEKNERQERNGYGKEGEKEEKEEEGKTDKKEDSKKEEDEKEE